MKPAQYERGVAEYFRSRGYQVRLTPASNDYGVDVFATNGSEQIAVQAKMYGSGSRLVNRDVVMHLHGAKDYFGCSRAIIVTDSTLLPDATVVALKLGIEVLILQAEQLPAPTDATAVPPDKWLFNALWEKYVMPLVGLVMTNSRGGTNTLKRADWSGIERTTSNDRPSFIPIEIFEMAVGRILEHGSITRDYINQMYSKRASSGIHLVLTQVPLFEEVTNPLGLKLRPTAHQTIAEWELAIVREDED